MNLGPKLETDKSRRHSNLVYKLLKEKFHITSIMRTVQIYFREKIRDVHNRFIYNRDVYFSITHNNKL